MMLWILLLHIMRLLLLIPLLGHVVTYNLPGCNQDGNFDIVKNQQPSLTCTGLKVNHNIYWSIIDSSSQEIRIANCTNCKNGCPECSLMVEGYNVSRESNFSTTLQFLNHSLVTVGSTIKCSARSNSTNATCNLFVVQAYTIPQCKKNEITIKDGMQTPIICEGLLAAQNIYWIITYDNGTVSPVAKCEVCRNSPARCPSCVVTNFDFNVTREENSSTLVIQNNFREKDGTLLRCSKGDNKTHDDCTMNVKSLDLDQGRAAGLPVAAVAGCVVGFVVIVAIAIFIVLILKRRKFEEHINELYQSADDPDLPRRSPTNSPTPLSLANHSVDVQGTGSDGPENHVYAQVNKERKEQHNKPGKPHEVKQHTKGGKIQTQTDKGGAVECVSDTKDDNSVNNVYMNANESAPLPTEQDTQAAKKDSDNDNLHGPDLNTYYNTQTTRHQGDYTNVQPELNNGEGVTKTAETDDEYRHLQLARPEQLDENPTYNHLEAV